MTKISELNVSEEVKKTIRNKCTGAFISGILLGSGVIVAIMAWGFWTA